MTALPVASPRPQRLRPPRHLEIVPTRAQRRARPKLALAIVGFGGIVAILLGQLGLSILVAEGAYTISSLQVAERDLARQSEALAEQLGSLQSPQYLARNAESLGMVASGSLPYIDLTTGEVTGRSTASGGSVLGGAGGLVPNTTIEGLSLVGTPLPAQEETPAAEAADSDAGGGLRVVIQSGESTGSEEAAAVSSAPGTLPSPTTR